MDGNVLQRAKAWFFAGLRMYMEVCADRLLIEHCIVHLVLSVLQLSSHGAIVTRLASIEEMAGMNMLCSDKTGTLTLNKMVIQDDCPIYTPGVTKDDVLKSAALAAKWKDPPRDALDTLVLKNSGLDLDQLDEYEQVGAGCLTTELCLLVWCNAVQVRVEHCSAEHSMRRRGCSGSVVQSAAGQLSVSQVLQVVAVRRSIAAAAHTCGSWSKPCCLSLGFVGAD